MASTSEHRSLNSLLVATDFSSGASMAVDRAARLPLAAGATLHVLHILPGRIPTNLRARAETEARLLLKDIATTASRAATSAGNQKLQIVPALSRGPAYVEIIREARRRKASLIVVGRHGKRLIRDVFIGSTAERVVREGDLPVLVVNLMHGRPYRRPLVAVELTHVKDAAQGIVDLALRLIDLSVTRLQLLHVFEIPFESQMRSALTHDALIAYKRDCKGKAVRDLRRLQSRLEVGGRHLKTVLRSGDPPTTILREASRRHVDLITLGTHGRSGIAHALLGSVAAWVLRSASCDVAVQRPAGLAFEAP